MKNGRCPMCNSSEVYSNPKSEFRAGTDFVDLEDDKNEIYLTAYVCKDCGFAAMFVEDLDDIKDLPKMKGWKRVG